MVDDTDRKDESDLRRRAAWLLVMLAVVAALLVVIVSTLAKTRNATTNNGGPKPLDPAVNTSTSPHPQASAHHPQQRQQRSTSPARRTHSSAPPSSASSSSTPPTGQTSCPGAASCILAGDVGNGIQAINDYRTQHGQRAVPGAVSAPAQTCAVNNGNGCSGGWAWTELAGPNGQQAVQKILPFAHLLDPQMRQIQVGWAYDPSAKLYYFAIIRVG